MSVKIYGNGEIEGSNSPFQTGDFKQAMRVSVPAGWVAGNGGTIGSPSSGATRANNDTLNLFTLWWTDFDDATLPILTSTGAASTRGASAAADWAANKRLTVFDVRDEFLRNSSTVAVGSKQVQNMPSHYHRTPFGWDGGAYYAWYDGSNLPIYGSDVDAGAGRFSFVTGSPGTAGRFARTKNTADGQTGENRPRNIALLGLFKL